MLAPGDGLGARPELRWALLPILAGGVAFYAIFGLWAYIAFVIGACLLALIISELVRRRMPARDRYRYYDDMGGPTDRK